MITSKKVIYYDEETILEGFAAYPEYKSQSLVILCHTWAGRDNFICEKAELIASWGYNAFALDVYGKDILGKTKEENFALKAPFIRDRLFLQKRLRAGLTAAKELPGIDIVTIVVLGFGFGGLCALDIARFSADISAAISVYGHLDTPDYARNKTVTAKIFLLHGYNDPIVNQQELLTFQKEMDNLKVDWRVQIFGNSLHAFTNPMARDATSGALYNPITANYAWKSIRLFLQEIF